MKKFRFYNNITGWVIGIGASVVYFLTNEPTASWWDCGEFIATSFKLEVGHPPGAPFFMLIAKLFSLLAGNDVSKVAIMINSMSALASGLTIMFLFWTITHFARKILVSDNNFDTWRIILIFGSGAIGAMAYAFTDTFWFSAVEAEVYAMSSFFTAIVFWLILKWENTTDPKYATRYIFLIAYLMGLSIGVHLLNLLAIPAIVFVFYFKNYKVNFKGLLISTIISIIVLAAVMYGIIPGVVKVASWFELISVNTFGLPYNSGLILYAVLLLGITVYAIYLTHRDKDNLKISFAFTISIFLFGLPFMVQSIVLGIILTIATFIIVYLVKQKNVILNIILNCFLLIVIGYSSFTIILIRAHANPPINENDPDNVFALLSYLNREQYGDRPLFYGQYYNAPAVDIKYTTPYYVPENGKYVISNRKVEYIYDKRFTTFFPRMYSPDPDHIKEYIDWGKVKGKKIRVTNQRGESELRTVPTFKENLNFFFRYQLGHMYFRYFMWNFSGRQNDIQGHGEITNGNWITGIKFIDKFIIGNQKNMPDSIKNQKSRNTYFLLPFILGLLGLLYHVSKKPKDFVVVTLLFIFTGIAIVVYLNQYPLQPRERDYAYAGSFYAFAIWIGIGVIYVFELFKKIFSNKAAVISAILISTSVPTILGIENWDDHDRSGRYTARDFAYNYLNSCAPNAIIFTNGDNDTFPLWYAQEVEGIRRDVRVVNLSLFNTDWYINQMRVKCYESDPLPITLPESKYAHETNNIIPLIAMTNDYIDLKDVINFVASDNPSTKRRASDNTIYDYIPTFNFKLPVNRKKVIENGTVIPADSNLVLNSIEWTFNKRYIEKGALLMLDILANNGWERPIYFVSPTNDITLGLADYLQFEGFAYRLVPIKTKAESYINTGRINSNILFENLMNKFKWGRMNEPDVYIDFYNIRTVSIVHLRHNFARLAMTLIEEGKKDSAVMVLDKACELMPNSQFPYDHYMLGIIDAYYKANAYDKADSLASDVFKYFEELVEYYYSFTRTQRNVLTYDINLNMQILQELTKMSMMSPDKELINDFNNRFAKLYNEYEKTE
jgi:hypothetical protein